MTKVSVVIPVYNIEQHLCQCLDSVSAQTLKNLEIICVDDGSTDASLSILKRYAAQDNRFQIIVQANAGPGAARNVGLERASGEFLIFLDSDDWFEPNFLEKMVTRAEETGADVTICRAVEFDTASDRELPSDWMLKTKYLPNKAVFRPQVVAEHLFQFTYGMAWDKLYRRSLLEKTEIKFPELYNSEDLVFVFSSLLRAEEISVLDEILIHHRVNRFTSVSNSRTQQPEAPYKSFLLMTEFLLDQGIMETYERSFLNWAIEFLVWHVSNMEDKAVQEKYFYKVRDEWLPGLRLEKHPLSFYENRVNVVKYLFVKTAPYPVFHIVVRCYKGIKKRWNALISAKRM